MLAFLLILVPVFALICFVGDSEKIAKKTQRKQHFEAIASFK